MNIHRFNFSCFIYFYPIFEDMFLLENIVDHVLNLCSRLFGEQSPHVNVKYSTEKL